MNKLRQSLTEYIITFSIISAGTSAIVINDLHVGVITHIGIALVFVLAVAAVIYSF